MKIVILDAATTNPGDLSWEWLSAYGEYDIYDFTQADKVLERAKGAQAIISNKTVLTKEILEQLPELKYVGLLSTGYNVVDCEYLKNKGIPVCNIPAYSTNAVAQMTFALILEIYNQVGLHNSCVHNGEWENSRDFCFWKTPLTELKDKTIGIIGFGQIGNAVAKIADAFDMNILAYTVREKPAPDNIKNFAFVSLDTLARQSDIVTLHCPLTPQTNKLIDFAFIEKMKKNSVVINTSRGGVIDEQALADALNSSKILAAGVDVLSTEPPKADNPLLRCEKCFITPHIAWAGYETRSRLMDICKSNLDAFASGKPINVVNGL